MGTIGNKSRTGMTNSPEMRKHISEALQGSKCGLGNKSRTGQKRFPEEIAKQIATRESKGLNFHTEETRHKISSSKKGKPNPHKGYSGWKHTDEAKEKMSNVHKGKPTSPQCLEKAAESNRTRIRTEEEKNKRRKFWSEHEGLRREIGKKAWSDPEKVKSMVSHMRKARQAKPNKLEYHILELLNKNFPNEWEYSGNGGLILGRCCPDFVRNHGHNQVIEIYGDYWHQGENPQDRIDMFDKYGYQTLVVWESEFHKIGESKFIGIVLGFMQKADLFYYNPGVTTV